MKELLRIINNKDYNVKEIKKLMPLSNMNLKKVSKKNISFKKNLIENQLQSSEHMTKIIGRNST